MEAKYSNKRNTHIFTFIACICLFFSCILIIKAWNESKIYDTVYSDVKTETDSDLGKKIVNIQDTLKANDAINKQEYEKALQLIS